MSFFDSLKTVLTNRRQRLCSSDSESESDNSFNTDNSLMENQYNYIDLRKACMDNNYENVVKIIEQGIDINFIDEYSMTFLAYGIESYKITKILLEKGADPNINLTNGINVIHLRVLSYKTTKKQIDKSKKILKLLLKYGGNRYKKNIFNESPLDYSCNYELCKYYNYILI